MQSSRIRHISPSCSRSESLSTRWIALGARVSLAAGIADDLHEGGNSLPDHLTKETASESDDATPGRSEFVLECSFQLGPQGKLIGVALFPSPFVRRSMGVKGIYPSLPLFRRG